ncbi:MAG: hypothetical protein KBE14_13835 [Ottowia sp.]|nr:hypothetical protein [Ottowia sp.]MBP8896640.1 hypothetical protein [Ottowia sp.]MBP9673432.1 hypothetical protein [Ottowia sp.]TXI30035.1 MAG: hypothetical protein E6Q64_04895 [Ottowia sp.]
MAPLHPGRKCWRCNDVNAH